MTREEILAEWPGLSEAMIERLQRPWSLEDAQADIASVQEMDIALIFSCPLAQEHQCDGREGIEDKAGELLGVERSEAAAQTSQCAEESGDGSGAEEHRAEREAEESEQTAAPNVRLVVLQMVRFLEPLATLVESGDDAE